MVILLYSNFIFSIHRAHCRWPQGSQNCRKQRFLHREISQWCAFHKRRHCLVRVKGVGHMRSFQCPSRFFPVLHAIKEDVGPVTPVEARRRSAWCRGLSRQRRASPRAIRPRGSQGRRCEPLRWTGPWVRRSAGNHVGCASRKSLRIWETLGW